MGGGRKRDQERVFTWEEEEEKSVPQSPALSEGNNVVLAINSNFFTAILSTHYKWKYLIEKKKKKLRQKL